MKRNVVFLFAGLSLLVLLVLSVLLVSLRATSEVNAEEKTGIPVVTAAHWKLQKTIYVRSGDPVVRESEGWYKLPDKLRIEDQFQVVVQHGPKKWVLNKSEKAVRASENPGRSLHITEDVFKPDWDIKALKKLGAKVSVEEGTGRLDGQEYPVVDVTVSKVALKTGQKLGAQHITYYLDAKTGFIKMRVREGYDYETGRLLGKDRGDWDYAANLSDDLFVLEAPADVKVETAK